MDLNTLKNKINQIRDKFKLERIVDKFFPRRITKKDMKQNFLLNISLLIRHFVVTHKNLVMMLLIGIFAFIIFIAVYLHSYEKKVGEANKWFEISLSFYRKAFIERELTPEQRMQSLKQSIGRFEDVINRFGQTPLKYDALMYQGHAYFEMGDYNTALNKYKKIIDKKPGFYFSDFILINIGKCYEQLNNIQGALSSYQSVIEDYSKGPALAEAKFNIAKIKELTNKINEAFQSYQKIITEHPQSVWSQEARRRVLYIQALAQKPHPKQKPKPKPKTEPNANTQSLELELK